MRETLARVAWRLVQPLFRWSPRVAFGWRAFLLRLFGARIGRDVHIDPSARVELPWQLTVGDWSGIGADARIYSLGRITLGSAVTVSQAAHLCAGSHDYTEPSLPLLRPPITVHSQAWICADAFVGPGVTVGEGAVVGARAVAVKDVAPWTVVAGNPAKAIGQRTLKAR